MRRSLTLAMLALAGCVSSSVRELDDYVEPQFPPPKPLEQRKRIAVVDFVDKTQYGRGMLGTSAADQLQDFLVNSGQFRVFTRANLAKVLDEQKLGGTGVVDAASAVRVGKVIGVEYIATGTVTNFGYTQHRTDVILYQSKTQLAESEVNVQVLDAESGEVVFSGNGRGYADTGTSGSMGLGGRMAFDERIAGRSLRAAISKVITNLMRQIP